MVRSMSAVKIRSLARSRARRDTLGKSEEDTGILPQGFADDFKLMIDATETRYIRVVPKLP